MAAHDGPIDRGYRFDGAVPATKVRCVRHDGSLTVWDGRGIENIMAKSSVVGAG